MIRSVITFTILVAFPVVGQDLSNFEKVLFPVLSPNPLHGARETVFQTRLSLQSPISLQYYPATSASGAATFGTFPPGLTRLPDIFATDSLSTGRILYLPKLRSASVAFFYELDATRAMATHRTTVPVARERDFKTGSSMILGLSTEAVLGGDTFPPVLIGYRARNHIRVYDIDNRGDLTIHIQLVSQFALVLDETVPLANRDGQGPSYVNYADISLPDLCVRSGTSNVCQPAPSEVFLEPGDPSARYWAFATATDNQTAETSVFWPQ